MAHRRRGDLALQPHRRARPRPVPAGARRAAGRARRRARARRRSDRGRGRRALGARGRAQRSGRAPRARPRARGQGRAGLRHRHVRRRRARVAARHVLRRVARRVHRAARRLPRRRRVREGARAASSSTSRSWCCTGRRATASPASRTRWWSRKRAPRSRCSTASAPPTPAPASTGHLVDAVVELIVGDNAHVRYLSVQEHGPHTWQIALQRAHLGRDAYAEVVGGRAGRRLRAAAQRVAARRIRAARATSPRSTSATATRCSTSAPCRTTTRPTRAATSCSRARSRTPRSRCTRASSASGPDAQKSVAFQTNRNLVLTEGAEAMSVPNLEIEADDVKCSHASTVGPVDDDQLYYLATPRRAARGSRAPHRARLLRRRVRPAAGAVAGRAAAPQRDREDRAPRPIARGPCLTSACCAVDDVEPGTARALRRRRPPPLRRATSAATST